MTTWNMAGLRARNYKVPKRTTPKPIGPTIVDAPDHAGVIVNGTTLVHYGARLSINDPGYDSMCCGNCGFAICGCDRRCEDCGSLLHLADACDSPYDCDWCDETVEHDHDDDTCRRAHQERLRIAELNGRRWGKTPLLFDQIREAFLADREPPAEAHPGQVIEALTGLVRTSEANGYVGLTERARQRVMSWAITMEYAKSGAMDSTSVLLRLCEQAKLNGVAAIPDEPVKTGTPEDFARRYNFPVAPSISHGQGLYDSMQFRMSDLKQPFADELR